MNKLSFIKNYLIIFLLVVIFYYSFYLSAYAWSIGAVTAPDYQQDHRGIILVKLTINASPCQSEYRVVKEKNGGFLFSESKFTVKYKVFNCGAGNNFKKIKIRQFYKKTPVNAILHDTKLKKVIFNKNLRLDNGENNIYFPSLKLNDYLLEMRYE
ncbi:TPA: hypothetical protein ACXIBI_003632 [Proteus mirabilis]